MSSPKEKDAEFDVGNLSLEGLIIDPESPVRGVVAEKSYTRDEIHKELGWSEKYVEQLELLYGLLNDRYGSSALLYDGRDLIRCSKRQKAAGRSKAETDALIRAYKKERSRDESIFKALEKLDV